MQFFNIKFKNIFQKIRYNKGISLSSIADKGNRRISLTGRNPLVSRKNRDTNEFKRETDILSPSLSSPVNFPAIFSRSKMEYIGINAWFFLVVNLLKVPFQIFAWDNINWGSFSLNLLMLPVIGIGALLGIRMVKLFPEKAFRRFIQFVTILSVAMMLV